jgi:SAM-dependent methyltransferase
MNTDPGFVITPQQAISPSYLRCIDEEIEAGRVSDVTALANLRINRPEILAYKAKILGGSSSFDEYADWTKFLITEYGPRNRCLSFGSGIGRVEDFLVRKGLTEKIETIELCARENEAIRIANSGVQTLPGDLNFVELEPNSYDFVLCHGVLHHLINLEYVLAQINSSLKEDGILLVYEYVGETRWQFSEDRLSLLRSSFPSFSFNSPPLWSIGGFESVRSGDLRGLIQAQFGETCDRCVDYGGVYFPFVTCSNLGADKHLAEVVALDEQVSQGQTLSPCYHMGVYRKSSAPPTLSTPWTDEECESRLSPTVPMSARIKRSFKQTQLGQAFLGARRRFAQKLGSR